MVSCRNCYYRLRSSCILLQTGKVVQLVDDWQEIRAYAPRIELKKSKEERRKMLQERLLREQMEKEHETQSIPVEPRKEELEELIPLKPEENLGLTSVATEDHVLDESVSHLEVATPPEPTGMNVVAEVEAADVNIEVQRPPDILAESKEVMEYSQNHLASDTIGIEKFLGSEIEPDLEVVDGEKETQDISCEQSSQILEGVLERKKDTSGKWKPMWFVLHKGVLSCFKTQAVRILR